MNSKVFDGYQSQLISWEEERVQKKMALCDLVAEQFSLHNFGAAVANVFKHLWEAGLRSDIEWGAAGGAGDQSLATYSWPSSRHYRCLRVVVCVSVCRGDERVGSRWALGDLRPRASVRGKTHVVGRGSLKPSHLLVKQHTQLSVLLNETPHVVAPGN